MEKQILEVLHQIQKDVYELKVGQEELKAEMKAEMSAGFSAVNKKLDLLTKQTSNAILEHHDRDLKLIKDKIFNIERKLYFGKQ